MDFVRLKEPCILQGFFLSLCMALEIKPTPTLTGKSAERFMKQARFNETSGKRIDFSKEVAKAKKILEKANLY